MIKHNQFKIERDISQMIKNGWKPMKKLCEIEGLPNVGNTCFINAIVQSLFASTSFGQHLAKLQTKNQITKILQQIFNAIKNLYSLDHKIKLMSYLADVLVQSIEDYQQYQEQDGLKFFLDIYKLLKQAFTSQLVIMSYQKVCSNYFTSQHHEQQRIYNFSNQLFMEACPQICRPCTEQSRKLVKKLSYLIKVPQNLMTFGEDFSSELSVYKLKILRPYFYILYYNEKEMSQSNDLKSCFSVIKYELKARTLYKGNFLTGHYITVRKRIDLLKNKLGEMERSQNYFKFDDLDVSLIQDRKLTERDKLYVTKFTLYEKCGQPISLGQFIKMNEKQVSEAEKQWRLENEQRKIYSLSSRQVLSSNDKIIIQKQRQKNIQQVIHLYHILLKAKNQPTLTQATQLHCDYQIILKTKNTPSKNIQQPLIESEESPKRDSQINVTSKSLLKNKDLIRRTKIENINRFSSDKKKINKRENERINNNNNSSPAKSDEQSQQQSWFNKLLCCCNCILPFFKCFRNLAPSRKISCDQIYRQNFVKKKKTNKSDELNTFIQPCQQINLINQCRKSFEKLTLKQMFQKVIKQGSIAFYRALFKNIWSLTTKDNRRLQYQDHQDHYERNSSVLIKGTRIEMKRQVYFYIKYQQLPFKQGFNQFKVTLIPDMKQLKLMLYRKYLQYLKQTQGKELSFQCLMNHQNLQREWLKGDCLQFIRNYPQLPSFIQKSKISSIYQDLLNQIVDYQSQDNIDQSQTK